LAVEAAYNGPPGTRVGQRDRVREGRTANA
jgi:hypothetical protein